MASEAEFGDRGSIGRVLIISMSPKCFPISSFDFLIFASVSPSGNLFARAAAMVVNGVIRQCLEIFFLRGDASEIKNMTKKFQTNKKMDHVKLIAL